SFQLRILMQGDNEQPVAFGSQEVLNTLIQQLGADALLPLSKTIPEDQRISFDPKKRQIEQVKELENHIQGLMHTSSYQRNDFFLYNAMPEFKNRIWNTESYHPYYSPERFIDQGKWYRDYFAEEIIGRFHDDLVPPSARSRKIYSKERWDGYEVVLNVYDG